MLKEYLKRIADALRSALGITSVTTYYEATLSYAEDDTEYANPIFTKTDIVIELTEEQISDLPYYESGYHTTTGEPVYTLNMGELFVCAVSNIPTINAQDFPAKIAEVYEAGKAEGGNGTVEGLASVTFMNNDVKLLTRPVYIGDDCPDPKTQGRIETPTKESTVDTVYAHSGWSLTNGGSADTTNALANVTEDRTVYAAYTESARYYTVSFYDGDTLLKTEQVAYGRSSSYTYKKDNYLFMGWSPEPTNVTTDLICQGIWEQSYSFADASWEYINRMSESGRASEVFTVGDTKTETLTYADGTTEDITLTIVGFDHDKDGGGTTRGITVISNVLSTDRRMASDKVAYYDSSELHSYLNDTLKNYLPSNLNAVIKNVKKTYRSAVNGTNNQTQSYSVCYLWILDSTEMGYPYSATTRYPYFDSNAKKIGYRINGNPAAYWLRSGTGASYGEFMYVDTTNSDSSHSNSHGKSANETCGVRFGFCI